MEFAFIPGYKQHTFADQDPINIRAVQILGDLHDTLVEAGGYTGHALERFLVRVLFCLFADDTGIFERHSLAAYVEYRTAEDGSDLGVHLTRLFDVLNTPPERRQANLDELLADLPYVNGDLFAEQLGFADFNRAMRDALVRCTRFDWSQISPAIFGSLFQAVMEPKERRQIGGHYTSERDILKVIRSLFLDDLKHEFERARRSKSELKRFHKKLGELRFLDPACGCGCGRIESRYRYSAKLVYNNFPWPDEPTGKQRAAVEAAARRVLDIRKQFPRDTLADLYDPLVTPKALVRAHAALDRAVDRCYRKTAFRSDRQRVEYVLARYERLTSPLLPHVPPADR